MKYLVLLALLLLLASGVKSQNPHSQLKLAPNESFMSPDSRFTATVVANGKEKRFEQAESLVEIRNRTGAVLRVHDFSSPDGEHGYGVDTAQWTQDSQFFVFTMSNSGGHSPMYKPVVFWSRRTNRFYQLNDYTADETFSVTSPAKIAVATWPDLKPATVSLAGVNGMKTTQLR
jgi:hypothetical protein